MEEQNSSSSLGKQQREFWNDKRKKKELDKKNSKKRKEALVKTLGYGKSDIQTFFVQRNLREDEFRGKTFEHTDPVFQEIHWKIINEPGTYVFICKEDGIAHFAVQAIPIKDLSPEIKEKYNRIFTDMVEYSKRHQKNTTNGAAKIGGQGEMYCRGFRHEYTGEADIGEYAPKKKISEEEETKRRSMDTEIHNFYGEEFCKLAPKLFEELRIDMHKINVPMMGIKYGTAHNHNMFSSNLTYTWDFYNAFHTDEDISFCAYGKWARITTEGKIAESGFHMEGGHFINASYNVMVDFNALDCIVDILWFGQEDVHGTCKSTTKHGYRMFGSSCQTSISMADRISKWGPENIITREIGASIDKTALKEIRKCLNKLHKLKKNLDTTRCRLERENIQLLHLIGTDATTINDAYKQLEENMKAIANNKLKAEENMNNILEEKAMLRERQKPVVR